MMPDVRTYDRTALSRWLSGDSTPSDRLFMARLGAVLDEPEILSALDEDTGMSDREVRDVLTRFRGLSADRKRDVLPRLVNELFRDDLAVRNVFTMRIEVHGNLTPGCHRLDLSLGWTGRLPAQASVEVVADEEKLGLAYTRPGCIFRELVPIDPDTFADATAALREPCPVLRYRSADNKDFIKPSLQNRDEAEAGIYRFDNPEVQSAEIRLSACLPYPAELPMYPVMLGAYPVAGRAMITMVTDPLRCGRPHALRFLGQAAAWTHPGDFSATQLSVEIGDDDSLLEPNAGVIFFWLPIR